MRAAGRRLPRLPRPVPAACAAADRCAPPRGRKCRRNGCRTRRSARGIRPSACTSCRERPDRDRRSRRCPSGRAASRQSRPRPRKAAANRTADRRPPGKTAGHAHDGDRLGLLPLQGIQPGLRFFQRKHGALQRRHALQTFCQVGPLCDSSAGSSLWSLPVGVTKASMSSSDMFSTSASTCCRLSSTASSRSPAGGGCRPS